MLRWLKGRRYMLLYIGLDVGRVDGLSLANSTPANRACRSHSSRKRMKHGKKRRFLDFEKKRKKT